MNTSHNSNVSSRKNRRHLSPGNTLLDKFESITKDRLVEPIDNKTGQLIKS